jgi:hypothetical protein
MGFAPLLMFLQLLISHLAFMGVVPICLLYDGVVSLFTVDLG